MSEANFPTDRAGGYILSIADIEAYRGPGRPAGPHLRFYCPIHGGDHQLSFRLTLATGHFKCFTCGAWGYTTEARERWSAELRTSRGISGTEGHKAWSRSAPHRSAMSSVIGEQPGKAKESKGKQDSTVLPLVTVDRTASTDPLPRPELFDHWERYAEALENSPAADYLLSRGISIELAKRHGVGYAPRGKWLGRDVPLGRVVFPHTTPAGDLVSFYGRAIETPRCVVDAGLRHDHLAGPRGWWNTGVTSVSAESMGALFICEGAFDALSWIAAGFPRSLAIFGVHGWRWHWLRSVRSIVLSLDMDTTGAARAAELAREGVLFGKDVRIIEPTDLGGAKDVSEAWQRKTLAGDVIRQAITELVPGG